MKIYLDTCSLQRPLDDKAQLRIRLEAEAILSVLDLIKAGRLQIVSSDVLLFEIGRNRHPVRHDFALEALEMAMHRVRLVEEIEQRAFILNQGGIDTLDSLHLACAEAAGVDYFCTCDDAFLKKAKCAVQGLTKVVSPLELAEEMDRWPF